MKKLRLDVAFDLDGTLVDLMTPFEKILKGVYGVNLAPEMKEFKIKTNPVVSDKVIWDAFSLTYKCFEDTHAIPGADELLYALHSKTDDPITIVTARPHWAATETHKLVRRCFPGIPYNLVFANSKDKLKHIRDFKYFVDDRRKTAVHMALEGKHVFVPAYDWNEMTKVPKTKAMERIKRIGSIADLLPLKDKLVRA